MLPGAPKFRLVALDLDGTTLNPKGQVAPRTRDAIAALTARGTYVAFATGRNYNESRLVLEQAGHFPLSVFVGGANVVDTGSGKSLARRTMDPALARELSADFEAAGHCVLALQDAFTTGVDYLVSADLPMDVPTEEWMKTVRTTLRRQSDLPHFAHTDTLRVGIVAPTEEAGRVYDRLGEKYAGRVVMHRIHVHSYGSDVVEVFDPAVNKWQGVMTIAGMLGVSQPEIVTVGDDVNDLPMLRQAGLGVAMGNAHPEAKKAARLTIAPHSEDGLAQFLEQLIREDRTAAA